MSLKAVFFDLDGTLLDTAVDLGNALNHVLAEFDKPIIPLLESRNIVSNGAAALIKAGFKVNESDENFWQLREKLLDYYLQDLASHTTPFEGIEELISKLAEHGIKWGIVTNKPVTYAEPLMKFFQFASEPVALICPDHVTNRKPDPEALILACKYADCAISEALYVGDHLRDIQCGQNAGMPTVAVSYGYIEAHDDYRAWNATHCVDHASEIWPLIQNHYL